MAFTLLLAYGLRVLGLTSESLWIDEGYSLALANHNLFEIVHGTAVDQHPPFYYVLLHFWLLIGKSVFHLRYSSVLIGTVGVAIIARIGRMVMKSEVGAAAALLLSLSPVHIWYSQEARMYILLAPLTALSVWMLWRILHGKSGWLLYGLSTLLSLYTHNFAIFIILFENIFVFYWWLKTHSSRFLYRWGGMQILLMVLFAPWVPIIIRQVRSHNMSWIHPPTLASVRDTLVWMILGRAGIQRQAYLSAIVLGIVTLMISWSFWNAYQEGRLANLRFMLLWFLLPFVLIVAISYKYPIYQSKQFLIVLTPLCLVLAAAFLDLNLVIRLILVLTLSFFVVGSLKSLYTVNTKHGWREAGKYIDRNYETGDALYLNPAAGIFTLEVYLNQTIPHDGYPLDYDIIRGGGWAGEIVTESIAEKAIDKLASQHNRIWLVEFGPRFWDPETHLSERLEYWGRVIEDRSFRGVRVRLYDLTKG
jgi:uncharacterized membrane protein